MLLPIQHGTAVLVDRNAFQRKMLRTLLRSSGFIRVTEMEDLEHGLDESARTYPDFLFADFDTAQHSELMRGQQDIKQTHLSPNTHLVVLMQNPTRNRVDKAISCGAHWVISRPFSPMSLNQRLRAILEPASVASIDKIQAKAQKQSQMLEESLAEDVSMAELAKQMDALLKQSRYYKEASPDYNHQTKSRLQNKFKSLEQEYNQRQQPERTNETAAHKNDILLI